MGTQEGFDNFRAFMSIDNNLKRLISSGNREAQYKNMQPILDAVPRPEQCREEDDGDLEPHVHYIGKTV